MTAGKALASGRVIAVAMLAIGSITPIAQAKPKLASYRHSLTIRLGPAQHVNLRKQAERSGFKKVSSLVNFPTFFPGLGIIYVKPATLPVGPFLTFDRVDQLIATVYMVPVTDLDAHKKFEFARLASGGNHVTLYFNAGHPGVMMPHYHVVVWHVPKQAESRVAK